METLHTLVTAGELSGGAPVARAIADATDSLQRFTAAFNACDVAAMDAELHFPHLLLSGSEHQLWSGPGQHPAGLFESLRSQGWSSTRYESIEPVLASPVKIHVVVVYTRRRADDSVISTHENLWVVVRRAANWGIALRSY